MGRTKRKRNKSAREPININLGTDQESINLKQWLKTQNPFYDPLHLQLRNFSATGRGVSAKKSVQPSEVLLKIPFRLLITFDSIRKSELVDYFDVGQKPLTIHTLLAVFLVMEKHKGKKSKWKNYIESLPYPEPLLPWMCNDEEFYPDELKSCAVKLQQNFEESFKNLSLNLSVLCKCCKNSLNYLLDFDMFKWAYVLVNTRAVYIDADYLISNDNSHVSLLVDEPILALCPYLDLINHHYKARTKANVVNVDGEAFYQLITMTGFSKYEQIFISYGAHSNDKLFMEYGFFIPGNVFDFVKISFKEILEILKISLDERQYKAIKNYKFNANEVYINQNGPSFVLKAILFVGYYPEILNYGSFIFSNRFPSDFSSVILKGTRVLLNFKLEEYKSDVRRYEDNVDDFAKLMSNYLEYRVKYVQDLLLLLEENKLCF
ncbi:unnamed protein product [Ceutorhynchus assimilis]|uniref:SET domain-containing protein n=1 Tax=Ceutorhynchus assimilis TaxID=467358 RepID=A0A9N9MRU4_9CUCU|nr:unnamed protein product [Ceutorhynchus assimilis]